MKSRYIIYIQLLVILTLFGCHSEKISPTIGGTSLQIQVKVSANALALPEVDNTTRALVSDENTINELQVILFDELDKYIGTYPVVDNKVAINYSPNKRTVYVVANANAIIDGVIGSWGVGTMSIDEVCKSLHQKRTAQQMPSFPFVMYSKLIFERGIDANSAITTDGTVVGSPLLLRRNVAKITIGVAADLAPSLEVTGVMLCGAPQNGYLLTDLPFPGGLTDNYNISEGNVDVFSFTAAPQTTVIVKVNIKTIMTDGLTNSPGIRYFKLAIKESNVLGAKGLKHNNWYKINIVKCSSIGFASLEDAINGHVLDTIETTLDVLDITMNDFVFGNGSYIATSNSFYEQYGVAKDGNGYYEACKVRFANIETTLVDKTSIRVLSGNIELLPETVAQVGGAVNHSTYSVMVKPVSTTGSAAGVLRIEYGSVYKDVEVGFAPTSTELFQYVRVDNALVGRVVDVTLNWCGIGDSKVFVTNKHMDLNVPTGGTLYLTVDRELAAKASLAATALFARFEVGLAKVVVYP